MKLVTNKFKSGGLHEKRVVATWNFGKHKKIYKLYIYIYIYIYILMALKWCVLFGSFQDFSVTELNCCCYNSSMIIS